MKFMIYTHDKDGALAIRTANRPAHLEFLRTQSDVKVISAGPWLADDSDTVLGSLLVVEATCINCVTNWMKNDPYVHAGLTAKLTIHALAGWTDFS